MILALPMAQGMFARYTELDVVNAAPDGEGIMQSSEHYREDDYRLDDAALLKSLRSRIEGQKMSASLLNKFVEYNASQPDRLLLLAERLLSIPERLNVGQEFGILVHAFMRDYLDRVIKARELTVDDLVMHYHQRISWLDFSDVDVKQMHQRLDGIITVFLPGFSQILTDAHLAEHWIESTLDGIPLSGKCDLLELDETNRTIRIFDYKTGTPQNNNKPNRSQIRQLQFYKLLLENSSEYRGWQVSGGADIFVEPLDRHENRLIGPRFLEVSDADTERLCLLIKAVWYRMRNGLFNTSGFEDSKQLQYLRVATACATGGDKADKTNYLSIDDLQEAFELWLIEDYLDRLQTV